MDEKLNDELKNIPILGTFEGECADADITNENGLDITRPVWETVFSSELYQQGIDLGWYIGYLGHPDDPGYMNFQEACIVMTEGHIEDDGKVYGKFNLIDTPVGRIVKTFIDAGVTFGISVRGAGDIIDNSVDPDTFVFRGFDLVTFPAYKEAIPEFTAIAAATDEESRMKYKKICAAVASGLNDITSCSTLDILQEQFPQQSETYADLAQRKSEILGDELTSDKTLDEEKIDSLVKLYINEKNRADAAENSLSQSQELYECEKIKMSKKLSVMERIVARQEHSVKDLEDILASAQKDFEAKKAIMTSANRKLKKQLHDEKETNLQYKMKIEASDTKLAERDAAIQKLQDEVDKTVVEASSATKRASNLDGKVEALSNQLKASQQLIEEYQDAYASLYAQAVGFDLTNVSVTATTSVADLRNKIAGSSAQLAVSEDFVEPQQIDIDDEDDENYLITI